MILITGQTREDRCASLSYISTDIIGIVCDISAFITQWHYIMILVYRFLQKMFVLFLGPYEDVAMEGGHIPSQGSPQFGFVQNTAGVNYGTGAYTFKLLTSSFFLLRLISSLICDIFMWLMIVCCFH